MRYRFLLLLTAIAVGSLTFSDSTVAQSTALAAYADDGFVSISDPTLGDFKIENAPVTVQEYCDFLNAVATQGDTHHLYSEDMKGLIVYHPAGWFASASYSVVSEKADLPMTNVSLDDAMRYCNWTDFGQPTASEFGVSVQDVTEIGSYIFSDENGKEVVRINPNDIYFLPSVDQLAAAESQINFPADADFYEWTSTPTSNADGSTKDEANGVDNLIFHSSSGEEPVTMVCDPSTINGSTGFRMAVHEEVVVPTASPAPVASSGGASSGASTASSTQSKTSTQAKSSTGRSIIGFTVLGIFMLASLPVTVMLGTAIILEFMVLAAALTEVIVDVGLDMGVVSIMDRITGGYMSKFLEFLAGVHVPPSGSGITYTGF